MGSSKLLEKLDALALDKEPADVDSDSDIEVLGPFPAQPAPKARNKGKGLEYQVRGLVTQEASLKPLHPLFLQKSKKEAGPSTANKPLGTSGNTNPTAAKPSRTSYTAAAATSNEFASGDTATHFDERDDFIEETNFTKYSYKDYTDPKPYLVYTTDETEADDLVAGLKSGPVAFDMEWRVFFVREGRSSTTKLVEKMTAVVQVADTAGVMLVIQVNNMHRFPRALQALIENPDISKMGVNILNDGKKLFRDYGIIAKNLVELGAVAFVADPSSFKKSKRKIVSLATLTQRYCGKILEKGSERSSNWEQRLNQQQLDYAANDVHSAVMIHRRLHALAKENGATLSETSLFTTDVDPSPTPFLGTPPEVEMQTQFLRAYRAWHEHGMTMDKMCVHLSVKVSALKPTSVISYVVGALQADPTLPFDMWRLRELVQMERTSWMRHREWILGAWAARLGQPTADEVNPAESGMGGNLS